MATAHLHPLICEIRVGPDGWEFGQPYDVCLTCVQVEPGVTQIRGLDKPLSVSQVRAIREALQAAGFTRAVFERHRADGVVEHKEIS